MTYEFDGEKYTKASAHQKEWGERLIQELRLDGGERILDLGCGDGVLTARLADLVPRGSVLGVDASSGMIASARQRDRPNLRFQLMDIADLDFHEAFDLIFSNAALHWVPDHPKLLADCHEALRVGGAIRLSFAADGNCDQFFEVIREVMSSPDYRPHFQRFGWPWYMPAVAEYRDLVELSAFRDAHVWGENADRAFADAEALVGWIDQPSIVPFLHVIPDADRASFRDAVVQRMIERARQPDGTYLVAFRRMNVHALK